MNNLHDSQYRRRWRLATQAHFQHTAKYRHVDNQGNALTLEVTFTYLPAIPGRYSGPPEDCYPFEPAEVEIVSVLLATASTHTSRKRPKITLPLHTRIPLFTKIQALIQISSNIGSFVTSSTYEARFLTALNALRNGGFIGPEQYLVPIDISDLLDEKTIDSIEAACFEEIERANAEQEPPQ